MPDSHALLSPSSASRWMACTPSARLEESLESTSESAEEGTLAHELCELMTKKHFGYLSSAVFNSKYKIIKKHKFYNKDMETYCLEFLNHIIEREEDHNEDGVLVLTEEQVDLSKFVPKSFGTVDNTIISSHTLEITDFKYGKGVLVEGVDNKQMKLYALGMIEKYYHAYGFKKVKMNIFQPRLSNYSGFTTTVKELLQWAKQEVTPKALLAFDGKGPRVAGDHCRFCKVKNTCKVLADMNMEIARDAFPDPDVLTDEDISDILSKADMFINWIGDIKAHALAEALKGKKWPGFKLVRGRSNRIISDPKALLALLMKQKKLKQENFLAEPSLLTLTKLESNLGHELFDKLCSKYVLKPLGSPTLVNETDKRDEIGSEASAKKAFENL